MLKIHTHTHTHTRLSARNKTKNLLYSVLKKLNFPETYILKIHQKKIYIISIFQIAYMINSIKGHRRGLQNHFIKMRG